MSENPKDPDERDGQQFTTTDWDWVMFLSGEINTIKTNYNAFSATTIAVAVACIGFLIACLILDTNSSTTVIFVGAVIFGLVCCISLIYMGKKRDTEKRLKPLKKCREDILNRLDDPNRILECYLNAVGKKGDKNK